LDRGFVGFVGVGFGVGQRDRWGDRLRRWVDVRLSSR
jgi:hypothetical protein